MGPKEHAIAAHGTASITDAWGVKNQSAEGRPYPASCLLKPPGDESRYATGI